MADHEPEKQVVVERDHGSNAGVIIAVIIGVIILIALVVYGVPYLGGGESSTTDVNVTAPTPSTTGN